MKISNCPEIILLSGTPGTGKSTIGRYLNQNLNWIIFNLGDFIIQRGLYVIEDDGDDSKTIDVDVAIECVLEMFKIYARNGEKINHQQKYIKTKPIVIDSHYADIIVDGIRIFMENPEFYTRKLGLNKNSESLRSCISYFSDGNNIYAIILRCDPSELEIRLNNRDYSELKIQENIQAEILGESTNNMLEVLTEKKIYEINTSKYGIEESSKVIVKIISEPEKFREKFGVGTINWMSKLSEEGTLEKYFKNKLGLSRIVTDMHDLDKLED